MIETFSGPSSATEEAHTLSDKAFDKIYAASQPGAVFSPPVVSGAYTVITASEVTAGGGFGFGSGPAPAPASNGSSEPSEAKSSRGAHSSNRADASSRARASGEVQAANEAQPLAGGGGGGGGSMGRPVAAIIIGPEGVEVKPIVDATKVALAAIGAWATLGLMFMRARAKAR